MLKASKFSIISIILLFVFCLYLALGNFINYSKKMPFSNSKVNLGLDISGGTHLLLRVNTGDYLNEKFQRFTKDIIKQIRTDNVNYLGFSIKNGMLYIRVADEEVENLTKSINKIYPELVVSKDAEMSVSVGYGENQIEALKKDLIERSVEIIRKRVDATGTKDINLYRQGTESLVLEVPGIKDPEAIKNLLNTKAKLSFHFLSDISPILTNPDDLVKVDQNQYEVMKAYNSIDQNIYIVKQESEIDGSSLLDASANITDEGSVISFRFDTVAAQKFSSITAANIGKPFAIVIDNKVISTPVIKTQINGGSGVISGAFSLEEAKNIALLLRSGALPTTIDIVEEGVVGPTFGQKFLKAGMISFLASIIFVSIFMTLRYGVLGVASIVSILYNSVLVVGLFSLFGLTLTIAGIAGVTLTVGMAVDANVLIFERIKEEMSLSKSSIFKTLNDSFKLAFAAIVDSNITTIIAGVVIFTLAFGSIKGFAIALIVGVLASMVSCVFVTRIICYYFTTKAWIK
jgi:preprotein translocase subunit SecD